MLPHISKPSFGASVIEDTRQDGYWVETFHFSNTDPVPGVITSGLVSGEIGFLDNPIAARAADQRADTHKVFEADVTKPWTKYLIGKFVSPVAVVAYDITKNGLMDLIICHDYGSMLECNMKGGWISWLENPGRDKLGDGFWKQRKIGRWPAMYRLKAGYFTQRSFLEIVGASIVSGERDKTTPVPIIRFLSPENILEAIEWPREVIDNEHFTVIHEVTKKRIGGPDSLDSLLISSREGITWLYFEGGVWKRDRISIEEPQEPRQLPDSLSPGLGDHWGVGCADVGKLDGDPFAYIATLEPCHGISACVYTKTSRGMKHNLWKRHVLDTYGTPNQRLKRGDGPGQYIVCADFDGDGDDEFLLALVGPLDRNDAQDAIPPPPGSHPYKGIMYYKAIDIRRGLFAKWRIASGSSARIAIGDFGGAGNLDLVSTSFNVRLYYEEPKPVTTLHLNQIENRDKIPTVCPIVPTAWDNECLIYLARAREVRELHKLSLIEIANYAISVEIHPKDGKISLPSGQGIKVLYGSVHGEDIRKPLGRSGFPTISPVTSNGTTLTASVDKGAIMLRLVPLGEPGEWGNTEDVPVKTIVDLSKMGLKLPPLNFRKVEDLWFGGNFKGKNFWNLSGFHFRFADDKSEIAHMQFWTAGPNVDCGVHNHSADIFQEIHICLSPGTGNGGMSRLIESKTEPKVNDCSGQDFEHVVLPRLYEHGGMWYRDSYGTAVRNKENAVAYPYHKWQAGSGPNLDIWLALEFNPDQDL